MTSSGQRGRKAGRDGIVLFAVMLAALLLIGLVGSVGILTKQNVRDIGKQVTTRRAHYAAQAGLAAGVAQLTPPAGNLAWDLGLNPTPLSTDPGATYEVEVFNNIDGLKGDPGAWAPDGETWVPAGAAWLRSVGKVNAETAGSAGLFALAGFFRPRFDHAAFGVASVVVDQSSSVIAYNSDGTTAPLGWLKWPPTLSRAQPSGSTTAPRSMGLPFRGLALTRILPASSLSRRLFGE